MRSGVGGSSRISLGRWVFGLSFFSYCYFYTSMGWNENSRFDLVRSIVERQQLDISPYHSNTGDKSFYDGHYYSDKAPGAAFLAVPGYALWFNLLSKPLKNQKPYRGLVIASFLSVSIVSALGLFCFYIAARHLSNIHQSALLATVSVGVGTLAFPYSTVFMSHQISGALLFISFSILLSQKLKKHWEFKRSLLAGLTASYAVMTEYPAAVPAFLLFLYLTHASRSHVPVWAFVVGSLPPMLLLMAYHTVCFDSPWRTGYSYESDPTFATGMSYGLMGLSYPRTQVLLEILFGLYRGLLPLCPVLVLCPFGLWCLLRAGQRSETILVFFVVVYYLLLSSSYYMWWGGAAVGPRHSVPMLSFLVLPLATIPAGKVRTVWALLLAYSAVTMIAVSAGGVLVPEEEGNAFMYIWSRFASESFANNLGVTLGLRGAASLVPLVGVWIISAVLLYRFYSCCSAGCGNTQSPSTEITGANFLALNPRSVDEHGSE